MTRSVVLCGASETLHTTHCTVRTQWQNTHASLSQSKLHTRTRTHSGATLSSHTTGTTSRDAAPAEAQGERADQNTQVWWYAIAATELSVHATHTANPPQHRGRRTTLPVLGLPTVHQTFSFFNALLVDNTRVRRQRYPAKAYPGPNNHCVLVRSIWDIPFFRAPPLGARGANGSARAMASASSTATRSLRGASTSRRSQGTPASASSRTSWRSH